MFDLHRELVQFYDDDVRLQDERQKLARYRNLNIDRLEDGLVKLGELNGKTYENPIRTCNQGSYAMHTLNKNVNGDPDRDYDIDVAVIFRKDALPSTTLKARQRIEAAFQQVSSNFSKTPKARTNAVTVWYKDGYHIDFAIYRESMDEQGNIIIEHAGPDWNIADPVAMVDWFNGTVRELSPKPEDGATVKGNQMRRIVRLLKAFAKSRSSDTWNCPGGLIISALVSECYQPHASRDDIALYNTMVSLRARLLNEIKVVNPILPDQYLTSKKEYENQVTRFCNRLGEAITQLQVLFDAACTKVEALNAWHWVFKHDFWKEGMEDEKGNRASHLSLGKIEGAPLEIRDTGIYG